MKRQRRYRHPSDTELKHHAPLSCLVLDAIRMALFAPSHPDSKRQRKTRQRACERRQGRWEKQNQSTWIPELPVVWTPPTLSWRSNDW